MQAQQGSATELIGIRPLLDKITDAKPENLIKTYVLMVKRVILLAVQTIPSHHVASDATVYCIEDAVDITAASQMFCLNAVDVYLLKGGVEHSLLGLLNASILITIHL